MRGRSSQQESKEGMEIDSKLSKFKDEPHLSGAYIRSLVKQLTSSRTKDPMNPKDSECVDGGDQSISGQNLGKFGEGIGDASQSQQPQQPQQHKKQVRRRLHTSRPYQERLLNMAEARREIVTALKFHRAAMKQASEQQQQQLEQRQKQQSQLMQPLTQPCFEQEGKIKSRRNPRIYPSNTANFSSYLDNVSYSSYSCPPPNPYSWHASQLSPRPFSESLNFALPNQTLGLNLNLHDFNNLDASLFHSSSNDPSIYSSSSPSSSSSPTLSFATVERPSVPISQEVAGPSAVAVFESCSASGLHPAMDDEGMAEIRSIGEQHQMEWNDTMNLVTSAWWFKFLKTMELGPEEMKTEDDGFHPFDEVTEFPSWLNANDSCLQQHISDNCTDDYFQDPALPCMDIGEFEGMDSEWLA